MIYCYVARCVYFVQRAPSRTVKSVRQMMPTNVTIVTTATIKLMIMPALVRCSSCTFAMNFWSIYNDVKHI